jgi:hypothetical protein
MSKPKSFTKEQILVAMSKTKSNRAAARYLHCSLIHYRKYARLYRDEATGKNLYELHKNQAGKKIPKFLPKRGYKKGPSIFDIINGNAPHHSFTPQRIKERLIVEGLLNEECACCGFMERRVLDYKIPLLFHYKDGNKQNYTLENLELLCYNCYFLRIGDVFDDKEIQQIEDYVDVNRKQVEWELDDYQKQRLKEMGFDDDEKDEDDLLSYSV